MGEKLVKVKDFIKEKIVNLFYINEDLIKEKDELRKKNL